MRIIVLGGPGAGKGTQLLRISKKLSVVHISTGDIFRENISKNTKLGYIANEYISKGQLVPDQITCDMVIDRIAKEDCKNGYALDGFPRTIVQAKFLDNYLAERREEIDAIVDIEVNDDIIVERLTGRRTCLKCGATYHIKYNKPKVDNVCDMCGDVLVQRKDDELDTIQNRLKVYHAQTELLKSYYEETKKFKIVNGDGSTDEVEKRILSALEVD